MSSVWLVHEGCQYEGGGTTVVCKDEATAISYAKHKAAKEHYRHVRRRRYEDGTRDICLTKYKRMSRHRWLSNHDIILVYEMKVY